MTDTKEIMQALAQPFEADEVKFKPAVISSNRAMALAYVDARVVLDRLDDVLGIENWQDTYEVLASGSVMCNLRVKIGGEWITKTDVGSPSEQPDEGDRLKAAFCVPLDAMALTPSGWTTYDRLAVGDSILGYDLASGLCRWTAVMAVNVFDAPREMLSLTSKFFNATCTPNHRWVVHRRDGGVSLKETSRLDSRDRIIVAAPAEGGSHQLTAREAAVLGWLATDGSVGTYRPSRGRTVPQFQAVINQSKVATRDAIRSLLGDDAVEYITPPGTRLFPGRDEPSLTLERGAFHLRRGFAQDILSRAGLFDGVGVDWSKLTGLVTRLSAGARVAIFNAMLAGDGQHAVTGQLKFGKKRKPGVMEAFEVLATLQGVALGTLHGTSQDGKVPLRTLRVNPHTWHKCLEVTPAVPEACWCPTTELGTWVTMWSGQITITSNSDALKRAAVKLGISRYLYRLPVQWVDYDPQKRQFVRKPTLPVQAARHAAPPKGPPPPANGEELKRRILDFEAKLVARNLCLKGELVKLVLHTGDMAGLPDDLADWNDPKAIDLAVKTARDFEATLGKANHRKAAPTA